jgi:O-antigen/teichoic acid export membrane protein
LIEVLIYACFVRPPIFTAVQLSASKLWDYALPLFFFAMTQCTYDKLDIFMLKGLGGADADAGIYAAAQNAGLIPATFAVSFAPLLLSNLTRAVRLGESGVASKMSSAGLRAVLWIIPTAGVLAGTAPQLARLLFGASFAGAAPLMIWLFAGAIGSTTLSVAASVMIGLGRSSWPVAINAPALLAVLAGYLLFIPAHGAIAAAQVSAIGQIVAGLVALSLASRLANVSFPFMTILRGLAGAVAAYAIGRSWVSPGALIVPKVAVQCFAAAGVLALLGEFGKELLQSVGGYFGFGNKLRPAAEDN